MFTVVEDEEEGAWGQPGDQCAQRVVARRGIQPEGGRHGVGDQARIGYRYQIRDPHPIGVCVDEPASHLLREPCLAGTTHPGERE